VAESVAIKGEPQRDRDVSIFRRKLLVRVFGRAALIARLSAPRDVRLHDAVHIRRLEARLALIPSGANLVDCGDLGECPSRSNW
jgi:hypothetical protein